MYRTKDEAQCAALAAVDAMIRQGMSVFVENETDDHYIEVNGEVFEYPPPLVIPPAMTPVWGRNKEKNWHGPFVSTGEIVEGRLKVWGFNGHHYWPDWRTTPPEGWKP